MTCGTILYDPRFQFRDGAIIDKLIIVIGELGGDYLALITTTNEKGRSVTSGCNQNDRFHNYFIPAKVEWFNKNTWVELDEVHELDGRIYSQKKSDGAVQYKATLAVSLMKKILSCALESQDIDLYYLDFIKRWHDAL